MPALRRRRMASLMLSFLVLEAFTANTTCWIWLPSTTASAMPSSGGPSITTWLKPSSCAFSISIASFGPISSSTGSGGVGPASNTLRLGIAVGWISISLPRSPLSRFDKPRSLGMRSALCTALLRMSASISSTRWPSCAKLIASAIAVVVLPSLLPQLVTMKRLGAPSAVENCSAVRMER